MAHEPPAGQRGTSRKANNRSEVTTELEPPAGKPDGVERYIVGLDSMRTLSQLGHGSNPVVRRYDSEFLGSTVVVELSEQDAKYLAASPGVRYVEEDSPRYPVVLK
jgi:hypothetical protein